MKFMNIHGHEVDVQNSDSDEVRHILHGWQDHEGDFNSMREELEKDPKMYIGKVVFERKNGRYILRKSAN